MNKVLAALDNSAAATSVLGSAHALAALLDSQVEALHVRVDGQRTVQNMADAAGVRLRTVTGPVAERLVEAGETDDVIALVIGARGTSASSSSLGARAAAVASALSKPVLVVPPECGPAPSFRRVLVPLEGTLSSSLVPRWLFELHGEAGVDVVALHIHDERSFPSFTDQPQHEAQAWAQEFLQRYCPWGIGTVHLETRVGRIGELVPAVAEQCGCDLIALGWSRQLSGGRAPVVHETIERSHLPVLLVPVAFVSEPEALLAGTASGEGLASPVGRGVA